MKSLLKNIKSNFFLGVLSIGFFPIFAVKTLAYSFVGAVFFFNKLSFSISRRQVFVLLLYFSFFSLNIFAFYNGNVTNFRLNTFLIFFSSGFCAFLLNFCFFSSEKIEKISFIWWIICFFIAIFFSIVWICEAMFVWRKMLFFIRLNYQPLSIGLAIASLPLFMEIFYGSRDWKKYVSFFSLTIFLFSLASLGGVTGGLIFVVFFISFFILNFGKKYKDVFIFYGLILLAGLIFYKKISFFVRIMSKGSVEAKLSRMDLLHEALRNALDFKNILWGYGLFNSSSRGFQTLFQTGYYPHNVFVEILCESGMFSFIFVCSIFLFLLRSLVNFKNEKDFIFLFFYTGAFFLASLGVGSVSSAWVHIACSGVLLLQSNRWDRVGDYNEGKNE